MNQAIRKRLDVNDPEWLVHLARPFPVTAGKMQDVARRWGFNDHIQELLESFPEHEEFLSGEDFLTRFDDLEVLYGEEEGMPEETLRSPQD